MYSVIICFIALQKVVTNDHVLALVKLREEEESIMEEKFRPKLTRAKVKYVLFLLLPLHRQNIKLNDMNYVLLVIYLH